jgi:hypothetical protein
LPGHCSCWPHGWQEDEGEVHGAVHEGAVGCGGHAGEAGDQLGDAENCPLVNSNCACWLIRKGTSDVVDQMASMVDKKGLEAVSVMIARVKKFSMDQVVVEALMEA